MKTASIFYSAGTKQKPNHCEDNNLKKPKTSR